MPIRLAAAASLALVASPLAAAPVDDLAAALKIDRVVEVMRDEGLSYADDLASEMLPSGSSPTWRATVDRVYDTERMEAAVRAGFDAALEDTDLDPLLDFFESPLGVRVIDLELAAREAMVDEDTEDAARETFRERGDTDDARLAQVEAFVAANDLVEQNVTGALNASLAFYRGLDEGGALEMSEDEILSDVWSSESETRADTSEWLHAFLLLAYEPLENAELDRYIAVSDSAAGEALNRALFEGFNAMYNEVSYAMGLAAARQMAQTDL